MSKTKYTKEILEPIVKESISIAQVLRALGLREAGGSHSHISRKIKEYELDTSHFLGKRANCGQNHKGGKKKSWQETLIKREKGPRQHSHRLRRALIESGRAYKCVACGVGSNWNDQLLILQVDHKNRDWLDDRKENLDFLCPNCHSQTKGWCGSLGLGEITSRAKYCREKRKKDNKQKPKDPNWRKKPKPHARKAKRPPLDVLLQEVKQNGYRTTGEKYGVSDNSIRKWIKWETK